MYRRIRARRKELKMTQSELAQLTGYSDKAAISKIEHGNLDVPSSKVKLFARALNMPVSDLISLDEVYFDIEKESSNTMFAQMTLKYALETSGYFDGIEFTDKEINRIIKYARLVIEERDDD